MENKFLWLCAFIDVLETLYVGIYKIGSFPSIFLHSYFWGLDAFSLRHIFFIEFEPFVKPVMVKPYVYSVTKDGTFWKSTDALQPKGSGADSAVGPRQARPCWPAVTDTARPRGLASAPPATPLKSEFKCTLHGSPFNPNKTRLLLWNFF